jgi:hypothetical protein
MGSVKGLRWIVRIVWLSLIVIWLGMGLVIGPNLFTVDYLQESIETTEFDVNWLVDADWHFGVNCNSNNECVSRTAADSKEQVGLSLDRIEERLMTQRVAEVLLTAQADRQEPSSACYRKSVSNCLATYALGISKEIIGKRNTSNDLLLALLRLRAIDKAREGAVVSIPNDSSENTLALTAAALARDMGIPISLESGIQQLYDSQEEEP